MTRAISAVCVFWKREAGVDAETAAGDGNEGLLNPVPNDGCHEITVGLCLFDATPRTASGWSPPRLTNWVRFGKKP